MAAPTQSSKLLIEEPRRAGSRAGSAIRSHLVLSIVALLAAAGVVVLAALSLRQFHRTLGVVGDARSIWLAVEIALGVATGALMLAPATLAVARSVRALQLAKKGQRHEARIAAERAKAAVWYVVGLGVSVLVATFLVTFLAANDGAIRRVFLNWDVVRDEFPAVRKGFWLNVKTFMIAEVLVLIFGLFVAIVRGFPGRAGAPARFLAIAYTDVFRGFPLLIVIYLFVLGMQISQLDRDIPIIGGFDRDERFFWLCTLSLVLGYSAYVAEVYRAGLESIHWSQTAGARSLGLSQGQTLRHVVVPQAVRRIIPPLLNDFISLQKDTALLSTIGALDVVARARLIANSKFNLTPLFGAGLAFLVITIPLARVTDWLVRRDQTRMRAGG